MQQSFTVSTSVKSIKSLKKWINSFNFEKKILHSLKWILRIQNVIEAHHVLK